MTYPDKDSNTPPDGVIVVPPEPDFYVQRTAIRQMQYELIAEMENVYSAATCVQYGLDDYGFEDGIGQIHYTVEASSAICEDIATSMKTVFGEIPLTFPLKASHDDYYFIGQLYPDPETTTEPVNQASMAWFERFFSLLTQYEYTYVNSVSYEILNFFMLPEWEQLNYKGNPGLSGWYPPSSFLKPSYLPAMSWMGRAHIQLLTAAIAAGQDPHFQIGEPWWWDGSYSTGDEKNAPCFYDAYTLDLYHQETGNYAPSTWISNIFDPVTDDQWPFVDWLCTKLGQSTNYVRDMVKAAIPEAKATLLFFTPQVLSPSSELTKRLNFPEDEWIYPAYDFVQIEDYDWVIAGELDLVPQTFDAATGLLNYPLDVVHYFMGFVQNAEDSYIWTSVDEAYGLALTAGITIMDVWSYTQVMRDGIIIV